MKNVYNTKNGMQDINSLSSIIQYLNVFFSIHLFYDDVMKCVKNSLNELLFRIIYVLNEAIAPLFSPLCKVKSNNDVNE